MAMETVMEATSFFSLLRAFLIIGTRKNADIAEERCPRPKESASDRSLHVSPRPYHLSFSHRR
jgi:hypothetical protein